MRVAPSLQAESEPSPCPLGPAAAHQTLHEHNPIDQPRCRLRSSGHSNDPSAGPASANTPTWGPAPLVRCRPQLGSNHPSASPLAQYRHAQAGTAMGEMPAGARVVRPRAPAIGSVGVAPPVSSLLPPLPPPAYGSPLVGLLALSNPDSQYHLLCHAGMIRSRRPRKPCRAAVPCAGSEHPVLTRSAAFFRPIRCVATSRHYR